MILLPFRTDRPKMRPAYLTLAIILVCTGVQCLQDVLPPVLLRLPTAGPDPVPVPALIANYGFWGNHPTLSTLFTHMFIHGDWLHLIGNMLFLWIFGSLLEDAIRPWGLAAVYLGGGLCAVVAHLLISQALGDRVDVPMVGASGAVAGVMGLFMLRFHKTRVEVWYWVLFVWGTFWVRSIWALLYWIVLEVFGGVMDSLFSPAAGGVAHWAHVGGFVAGAIAAPCVGGLTAAKREYITDDPETNVEYLKRTEKARDAEKALAQDPTNAYLMRKVAQAYRRAGEFEQASEMYIRSVGRFVARGMMDQGGEVYLELIEYNDGAVLPAEIEFRLAQHLEAVRIQQSLRLYRSIVGNYPTRPEAEQSLLRLPVLYAQTLHQPFEALNCLNEFLVRFPQSQWAPQVNEWRETLDRELRQF